MQNTPDSNNQNQTRAARKKIGLFIFILLFIGFIMLSRHEPVNTVDCTPKIIASKPDIIMLGAWWCRNCYQAKKYFQQNNINYCEYDMENTDRGKYLYEKHGGGAVPIMLIGKHKLTGFSEDKVEHALSLLNKNSVK